MSAIPPMRQLILAGVGWLALASPSFGLDLVVDGRPVATIVASETPRARKAEWASDADAVRVLNDWIEKMTGTRLPVADAPSGRKPAVFIGAAALDAGLRLDDIDSPSSEGLRVVVQGDRALLAGQSGEATVRAVCRLLERLGCRYFMDHPLGEVYPRTETLRVADLDLTEKPGFLSRSIWGSRWSGRSLWKVWNGAGGVALHTGHSWGRYVPASRHFAEHPEYFALRDGERREGQWLCTSNPQLRRFFSRAVIERIRGGVRNPSISPPDGRGYCQCEACRAQDDPDYREPTTQTPVKSDRFVDFFDAVARDVATASPGSILNFYAYADYTRPPIHHGRVAENLCCWIAPIRYCRYHAIQSDCPYRRDLGRVIDGWAGVVSKLGYRTYNYNLAEVLTPIPKLSVWTRDVPYLKERGFVGINFETLPCWCLYGPHIYLSIRLAYDPAADAGALMDDYYRMFVGPEAGPLMKQYWETLDRTVADLPYHTGSYYALQHIFTPAVREECRRLLDRAATAAGDEKHRARVAMCSDGFANAEIYMDLWNCMNAGDWKGASERYDRLLADCERQIDEGFTSHYTRAYLERFVGPAVTDGARLTQPPNRMLLQLPDVWRFRYDPEDEGLEKGFHRADFDDGAWRGVHTYSATLVQQGVAERMTFMWYRVRFELDAKPERLALWFAEVDGEATVYVNGEEVGRSVKRRQPFAADVNGAARTGENVVAVRVDHRNMTELYLGGIIRPVVLIASAPDRK